MKLTKQNRSIVGFISMLLGLTMMAAGAFIAGEGYLSGVAKGAVVTASVGGGTVLAFGVGRKLLSDTPEGAETDTRGA